MKKFKLKSKKIYRYDYSIDLIRFTKDFKRSLVSKETFLKFLDKHFADVKLELFNIPKKIFGIYATGHNSNYGPLILEIDTASVSLGCGHYGVTLSKTVTKRACNILNSIVSL